MYFVRSEVETLDPSLSHLKSNNSVISIADLYGCIVSWLQYSLFWRQIFVGVEVFLVVLDALSLYLKSKFTVLSISAILDHEILYAAVLFSLMNTYQLLRLCNAHMVKSRIRGVSKKREVKNRFFMSGSSPAAGEHMHDRDRAGSRDGVACT